MGTQLPPKKGGAAPNFHPCLLWPNGWMDQDGTWSGGGPQPGHIVLDGDAAPLPKNGAQRPIFRPFLLWPNGCMYQVNTWYGSWPQPRRHCVRWGPSSPSPKGHSPQFLANVSCGQTTGLTKMPLGMEVVLGPGDFVFDGDPAPPRKKGRSPHPIFGPCLLWPNGWMDQDPTWYRGKPRRLDPGDVVSDGVTAPQFLAHVYCGHSCPSQLLLSSCKY